MSEPAAGTTGPAKLESWFRSGRLFSPDYQAPSLVHLVRVLERIACGSSEPSGEVEAELWELLAGAPRTVFVLLDGLGLTQLERLPPGSFLRRHIRRKLRTVFPSTTAAALTTLATGLWPSDHGVPGWWLYLPRRDLSVVTLPFVQRDTDRPLGELGLLPAELFPVPSIWPPVAEGMTAVVPSGLEEGGFTGYLLGAAPRVGYSTPEDAVERTARVARNESAGPFTYLYLPQYDHQVHRAGVTAPASDELLRRLDRLLEGLAGELAGRARLVITADHGLVDVPPERRILVPPGDELMNLLRCRPTGEPQVPLFHLRAGMEERFLQGFEERWGDWFALLTPDEAQELKLFGPGELSPVLRERLGSFLAIPGKPTLLLAALQEEEEVDLAGIHAGLSPAEMLVPLIVT